MRYTPYWENLTVFLPKTAYLIYFNSIIYPPGSKSEALRLGVHLILLYFIRISLLSAEIIFLFGCGCGCGWRTFFVFKSLDNNMVYTSYIDVYFCICKNVQANFVMGLNIFTSWRPYPTKTKIPICRTIFQKSF